MDFSTVIKPLRKTLLAWINQSKISHIHESLNDLSSCQFFNLMLVRVNGFKWTQGGEWSSFQNISVGQKVKRMRIVGRSVSKFYHSQLDLSLDNLAFNYIEMCSSESETEILRLLIAVIGVLVRSQDIVLELQGFMIELGEQQLGLFKIMIDYASKLGEKQKDKNQSPAKRQKKLVSRLESVQEDLQFYEKYTEQLELKLQIQTEEAMRQKNKKQQLQKEGNKLVKKIQHLESLVDELYKQLSEKGKQEDLILQRLNNNRQYSQEIVDKLMEQNDQYRQEIKSLRIKLSDKNQVYFEIQRLTKQFQKQSIQLKQMVQKKTEQHIQIQNLSAQVRKLRNEAKFYYSENQEQRAKLQLYEKTFRNDRTSYLSPEQDSIVFATALGQSYIQKTPIHFFNASEDINYSKLSESLNISRHTQRQISYPRQVGFLDLKDLQTAKENGQRQDKQNRNPNIFRESNKHQFKIDEIEEDNSFQLPQQKRDSMNNQMQIAISVIFDLYTNLQQSRKEVRQYKQGQRKRTQRSIRFASKINNMFD